LAGFTGLNRIVHCHPVNPVNFFIKKEGTFMNNYTIIGLVAAACTTISFFPQLIKTVKTRHTKDISLGMYFLISIGILIWFVYGAIINDLPLILANGISFIATGIILGYKLIYK